jgi:hypothetical protein
LHDHDSLGIRTRDLWSSSQHTQPLRHLGRRFVYFLCEGQFVGGFRCGRRCWEETVEWGIVALDTQKGPEPDEISPLILKKIVLVAKKPLAILFNLSLLFGFFPCM